MQEEVKKRELTRLHRLLILSIPAVLGLAALIYLYASKKETLRFLPCVVFEAFGIACPGCGATRCVSSIFRLDFLAAIKYNLAFFLYFWVLAGCYIFCVYKVIRYNKFIKVRAWFLWFTAAYFILFAIIRNFGFYPWHLESPYAF